VSAARDAILAAVRARLGRRPGTEREPPPPAVRPAPAITVAQRLELFRSALVGAGGRVSVVPDASAAATELARIATEFGARSVALSDGAFARTAAARLPPGMDTFDAWSDRARLLDCDLGVTTAQYGIAETGTLVLVSTREQSRLASLVPPVHVAFLAADAILATLGQALGAVRGEGREPACITLVTGPSRTADIELTLVVGVHGPQELHVIVVERNDA
jgi:L-lactate dehydrogenase complex protein LldG